MTQSLRALLTGVIDYAGMFPPAALPLADAVANWNRYQQGDASWMLGRFVCPAARVHALPPLPGRVTVTLPDAAAWEILPDADCIDAIETRCENLDFLPRLRQRLGRQKTIFLEFPPTEDRFARLAREPGVGFKYRTGGAEAANFPTSADLAAVLHACRGHGIFWKATAGLHHPWRHVDPQFGIPAHGFLNVLVAAVLADSLALDIPRIQAILDDDRPENFTFTDAELAWRGHAVRVEDIGPARQRSLRSFGSCSFEEPCQHLRALGWM